MTTKFEDVNVGDTVLSAGGREYTVKFLSTTPTMEGAWVVDERGRERHITFGDDNAWTIKKKLFEVGKVYLPKTSGVEYIHGPNNLSLIEGIRVAHVIETPAPLNMELVLAIYYDTQMKEWRVWTTEQIYRRFYDEVVE